MKQISLLSILFFCFGISSTVSGNSLAKCSQNSFTSFISSSVPSDTVDVELLATRTYNDSILYEWISETQFQTLVLRIKNDSWKNKKRINHTYNENGLILEKYEVIFIEDNITEPYQRTTY